MVCACVYGWEGDGMGRDDGPCMVRSSCQYPSFSTIPTHDAQNLERDGARRPAKPAATGTGSSGEAGSNAEYVSYLEAELKQTGAELKVCV